MPDQEDTSTMPVTKAATFDELGSSGLARTGRWSGQVIEEFLPELSGERARKVFREMRENDPVVGAVLFAIEMLLRNVTWRVEGENEQAVEFIESCMGDMTHTWGDVVSEILSMLVYGFSWHEVVYKRRKGSVTDPAKTSRYDDGKIGWAKIPIRSQDSLSEWKFAEDGSVTAFVQVAPPTYKAVEIPMSRSLLFRVGAHKDNPEGRSILRNAFRPWSFKKRIEEVEGIGIERDLAGIPVIYRAAGLENYDAELKKILRNVRRDEQEGLLLPLVYDEAGHKLLEFTLLSSPGSRQLDISGTIDRYNKIIATTCLADFVLLGQQAVGSFALASSKTVLFASALGAILQSIAAVFNRYEIPRVIALNGIKLKDKDEVKLVPGDIEKIDLAELGAFITALAGAGMPLFPDEDLEKYLRGLGNFPMKAEGSKAEAVPPKGAPPKEAAPKPEEEAEPEEEVAPPVKPAAKVPKKTAPMKPGKAQVAADAEAKVTATAAPARKA